MRHVERRPQAEGAVLVLAQEGDRLLGEEGVGEVPLRQGRGGAAQPGRVPAVRGVAHVLIISKRLLLGLGKPFVVIGAMEPVVEAVPPGLVDEVHLADRAGDVAVILEVVGDRARLVGQRVPQDPRPVPAGVKTGDDRPAGGDADGRVAVGAVEADAVRGDLVDVGRLRFAAAVAAGRGGLVLIGAQEKQIRPVRLREAEGGPHGGPHRRCGDALDCLSSCDHDGQNPNADGETGHDDAPLRDRRPRCRPGSADVASGAGSGAAEHPLDHRRRHVGQSLFLRRDGDRDAASRSPGEAGECDSRMRTSRRRSVRPTARRSLPGCTRLPSALITTTAARGS